MDKDLLEFLQAFREETTRRFDGIGQEFQNVRQEFGREFQNVRQEFGREFQNVRQEFGQEFQNVRQEFGQEFQNVSQELRSLREGTEQRFERLETDVRGFYILVEDLRGSVQIVAEGVAGGTEQLQQHREEMSKRFDTLESFYRRSYRALSSRVRKLEAI